MNNRKSTLIQVKSVYTAHGLFTFLFMQEALIPYLISPQSRQMTLSSDAP